jgi:Ni/Co efflux regulator RcnB
MRFFTSSKQAVAFAALPFAATMAFAQPAPAPAAAQPSAAGQMGYGVKLGGFFNDQHKQVARKYFTQRYAKAKDCPQGMEREGKVCKTPVAGRYWAVGQPLQKAVATYPVPDPLMAQLPPAPQGYEYVRAGDDILLVSKGGMHLVVDIIENVMG